MAVEAASAHGPPATLGKDDAEQLLTLSRAVGWGHSADDWKTVLQVGRVFGHRASADALASSGALFEFGPALASIGMILVAPPHRRRGLARAMMRHCLEAAGPRAVTLIATAQGEPLYRDIGFVEVERVCRVFVASATGQPLPPITASDRDEVVRLDRDTYGADRRAMIEAFLARAEATAVVRDRQGTLRGFGLAVRQGGRRVVGPVIAHEPDTAVAIIESLAKDAGDEVRIEIPTHQTRVLDRLVAGGARRLDEGPVMLLRAAALPGRRADLYALASRGLG